METSFPLVVGNSLLCVRINILFMFGSIAHNSGATRTIPQAAITAPRIDLLNRIVCDSVRPEYAGTSTEPSQSDPSLCAADPVVQAAVTELLTGVVLFHLGRHDLDLSLLSTYHLYWFTLMPNDVMVGCCGLLLFSFLSKLIWSYSAFRS